MWFLHLPGHYGIIKNKFIARLSRLCHLYRARNKNSRWAFKSPGENLSRISRELIYDIFHKRHELYPIDIARFEHLIMHNGLQ